MDKWIDNLRKQAGSYEHRAPEGLLDDIKKEMARRGVMPPMSMQPAKAQTDTKGLSQHTLAPVRAVWSRRAAVAAAVAAIVVIAFFSPLFRNSNESVVAGNQTTTQPQPASLQQRASNEPEPIPSLAQCISNAVTSVYANVPGRVLRMADGTRQADAGLAQTLVTGMGGNIADMPQRDEAGDTAPLVSNQPPVESKQQPKGSRPKKGYTTGQPPLQQGHDNDRRSFDIAIGYSGMGGTSSAAGNNRLMNDMYDDALQNGTPHAVTEPTTDAHHDMPVKVGVSLRYHMGSRWSLQTGVNYSYLSSDLTRRNHVEESAMKQKLHYISVPLSASYSVWHNRSFNVYLSAGGEAAKLVKGKATMTRSGCGRAPVEEKSSVSEHKLQYSVTGAAGVEYKAGNRLSVYAEPGVAHYFNNHSSVMNIYKDKPTQFTINVGLRVNLNK